MAEPWELADSVPVALAGGDQAAFEAFLGATQAAARGQPLHASLAAVAGAVGASTGADLVVVRENAGEQGLVARAVWGATAALASELEGSSLPAEELPSEEIELEVSGRQPVPPAVARAAGRVHADLVQIFPVPGEEAFPAGSLELYRRGGLFPPRAFGLGRLAAAHVGIALRLAGSRDLPGSGTEGGRVPLELLGAALAAGSDEVETAEQVVRLAAGAAGATGALLWRVEADGPPTFLAAHGMDGDLPDLRSAARAVGTAIERRGSPPLADGNGASASGPHATIVPLGEPPAGALQLIFDGPVPEGATDALPGFAARAAVALRRTRRAQVVADALRRSQTLIAVVGQVIAQLSLAHTLETAVERVVELTGSGEVAIYLREGERLSVAASSRDLEGAHEELAERLLDLALGPFRGRGFVAVEDTLGDSRLAGLEAAIEATGIRRALLVPLVVQDEAIGALGVYKRRPRAFREGEQGLLIALSSQLAVAVQNARLHERTKELGAVLERTLASERTAARQLRGLFEISHSFTRSLSLEATLDAVARTMVELFDLDAAAIRMPDERGEQLEARAVYVADPSLREAAGTILARPQPITAPLARRLLRSGTPALLAPGSTAPGDTHALLEPFLVKGSSAAVLPMGTPGEVLGTLTLLSLDPSRPLDQETVDAAMTVSAQAALAIDNARLYQQQKDFSETMQRSLLPRALPDVPGLEVGHVYESSADVNVGGDVYDFLSLESGCLAVVLGDVTGKGIQAAADMAMAKFSFRALARSYSRPSEFLARANAVVVEEIAVGKFITMLYVLADPGARTVACASAGHPPIRLVTADGSVSSLGSSGLALGIDPGQEYPEEEVELESGSSIVLYTDGVIEARRDGELYGEERLDELLSRNAGQPAQRLAEVILADCRSFSGGDLADDCAVVVLRLPA